MSPCVCYATLLPSTSWFCCWVSCSPPSCAICRFDRVRFWRLFSFAARVRGYLHAKEARRGEKSLTFDVSRVSRWGRRKRKKTTKQEAYRGREKKTCRGKGANLLQRKSPLVLKDRQHPPRGGNLHQRGWAFSYANSAALHIATTHP